jgi:putative nucleotidyltransferase with HDIG domain
MTQILETKPEIDAFLAKHQTIRALPENSTRIIRMVNDAECNTTQLLKLISQDAALAGRVLKTVNSSFYSLQSKITRLDRAVAIMGLRALKEVTLSSTLASVCKPATFGNYDARDLWDHSVGVAILARELAVQTKTMDAEEAFLAGILHDIPLLLEAQSEVEKSTKLFNLAEGGAADFPAQERQIFGFDHCELGERLSEAWKFPENIAAVVRWHHQPDQAPEDRRLLCRHIYVCDTLCCQAKLGCPLTCNMQEVTDEKLTQIGIGREAAATMTAKLPILLRLYMS